jgi:serine protease Do
VGGSWTQRDESGQRRGGSFWGRWWRGSSKYQKNGDEIKSAYQSKVKTAAAATAEVLAGGKVVALATVVDADGYLVTKASLLEESAEFLCRLSGLDDPVGIVIVGRNNDFDLALLKVEGQKLEPAAWREEGVGPGTFVAAVDAGGDVIGLGVVSTEPREVKGTTQANPRRAWLGVSLGGGPTGTVITGVIEKSAASRAGLQSGDQIKGIDGNEMRTMEQIILTIGKQQPGNEIKITLLRKGEAMELTAKLGSPPRNASPQDQWGGGPFSVRREGFPRVLTHDTIIRPEQCGGPLVDTDGNVVGVNIARALRVTTYAVPADTVKKLVEEMKKS